MDLAQTGITVEGLKQLKGLPLINVTVPTNFDPKQSLPCAEYVSRSDD